MQVTEELKKALHEAVMEAAEELGPDVVIKALCPSSRRAQADAGQWNGLSDDEKDQFVGSLVEYGTKFVAPLYAVVENIEKALMEKNRAQADAQPLFYVADDLTPEMVGEGRRVFVSAESFAGCSQALFAHPAPEAAQALSDAEIRKLAVNYCLFESEGRHYNILRYEIEEDFFNFCRALLTRASAATVAEPSEEPGWKNERCQYEVCDEEDEHDPRCTAWRDTESQEDSVAAFLSDVASQTPEKPDHWSSCAQCQHNAERAADLLSVQKNTPCGGKP